MRRPSRGAVAAAAAAVVLPLAAATPAVAAAPTIATGSATGIFCGARATFTTVSGVAQYHYIVDNSGRATQAHNGGCYGISPGHHIFWTPRSNPSWRLMPGGGIAVRVGPSFIGHACPPSPQTGLGFAAPTMTVVTAAGHRYGQTLDPFTGRWGGHWYRI